MSMPLDSFAPHHAVPAVLAPRPAAPAIVLQLVGHLVRTAILWLAVWALVTSGAAIMTPLTVWLSLTAMMSIGYASFIAKCWLTTLTDRSGPTMLVLCIEVLGIAQCVHWLS